MINPNDKKDSPIHLDGSFLCCTTYCESRNSHIKNKKTQNIADICVFEKKYVTLRV